MSEMIWVTATEPHQLLELLTNQASPRKLRLFACACCRQLGDRLSTEDRKHLDLCERFADTLNRVGALYRSDRKLLRRQRRSQHDLLHRLPTPAEEEREAILAALRHLSDEWAHLAAQNSWQNVASAVYRYGASLDLFVARDAVLTLRAEQAQLLRDIFGNPFRPAPIGPAPNDGVRRLAQLIYDERRFDHLPILADALEEAGCTSESVLGHCRSAGPHVRGCWVVDALLEKC